MSMPITFTAPVAPASPAPAGASATSGEPGALFGAVLSGISADLGGSPDDDREAPTEEALNALAAAGSAPLGGALLIGLNLPIGDGRTVPGATAQLAVRTPVVAATPTGGTGLPPVLSGSATPTPFGGTVPATGVAGTGIAAGGVAVAGIAAGGVATGGVAAGGMAAGGAPATGLAGTAVPGAGVAGTDVSGTGVAGTGVSGTGVPAGGVPAAPSTQDTAAPPGATAVVAGAPSTRDAPTVPVAGAPVLPATQAFAGAAAAAALTGTLAGSVAGATAAGTTPAPGVPKVAATDPVTRVATGPPGAASSTVDTGAGSPVETTTRSRHAFGDNAAGPDGGDGALPRGPEAGWAPTLAAARADSAAPTAPAAPGQPPAPQLPPAAQLALRLAPLRAGPDGTHQLTILLHPAELGAVSVVATVKGDQLSVQLTGATEVGRDALRAALPELERDLRDGGFATLTLNVRDAPPPDPRPAWATPTAPQPAQPAQPAQAAQPAQPTQVAPGAAAVTPTATDFATNGTATTTTGAKTDGQPIGQVLQPDGSGPIRRDDSTGQYSAAGAVAATHQSSGAQSGGAGAGNSAGQQQLSAQLNLGQPGGQPGQQPNQPGFTGGRHPGPAPDNGAGTQAGHPAPGEPDPPATGNRPANRAGVRSVDLRV
ncbi:flagellar hook-length control protein FliK [Virgisporangium aurantiacum]|uniref:Flagellar hook-length control protein-like C-terminal domain-containing protein n=1 Tax=Virgisporangium aurantiacum TaxID=175570 RepID=A0A8J3YXM5_9ACTN|nr:flagellar hook-length control protein FliK [Virgisporangium aurantiacum]GIJ52518.1 hypothetical protein Vau01_000340 [Virgisporangium aurantiacum]